jgi:UDP-glucose 4-epimerase
MRILIIGGAGYIGSHTAYEFIENGHEVTIFDNLLTGWEENIPPQATFIKGDILNTEDLKNVFSSIVPRSSSFDAVVHFAAFKNAGESMTKPEKYSVTNLIGTLNLLNAMCDAGVKNIVFSSSSATYGEPQYLPMNEAHPQQPMSYYGFTKLEVERYLDWYSQLKGIRFAALRYFNAAGYDVKGRVRGLEKNPANLLPIVLEVANGTRASMVVNGNDYPTHDGTCVRDYIHVNDLATAHVAAVDYITRTGENLKCNLATGVGYSILDVISMTEEITGKKVPFTFVGRREGDPSTVYATSTIAEEKLGWKAVHSDLRTLLASMWDVYKKG